ncbi:RDD family protein [Parasphingorhabdus litoris]|uniref:RDD family protein n=1 Tax=Parasphingorhabdus litoris TaxID=394733 RepID=A0ABP3KRT1_9SPHN|nr:RDD family protein [Parasphingorhabdus litoris]
MTSTTTDPWIRRSNNTKLDRIMVSPEGVPLNVTVATAGARAGALTLDIIIILGLILGVTLLGFLALWGFEAAFDDNIVLEESGPLSVVAVLWIISVFLFRNAYFLYFELGDRAATWGKRAVGIRVAARDGGRLTAEAVIARNIIRDIELFLPLVFISSGEADGSMSDFTAWAGFLWVLMFLLFPLFNKDRLRCGDLIAGTWVIQNVKRNLDGVVAPSAELSADPTTGKTTSRYEFSDADLSVYGEFELQTLESVLRTGTDEALATVTASICNKIGWEPGSGDERIFLEAYYTALRAKLERGMRFGKRRKDKFSQDI